MVYTYKRKLCSNTSSAVFLKTSEEKEENEVTLSGISNSVDYLQLKILILKIPCPVLFEIHDITGYIENYGGIFYWATMEEIRRRSLWTTCQSNTFKVQRSCDYSENQLETQP